MNPVVIIPTFVSARGRVESGPVTTTYDHTTSMSASGELPRCLESLRCVRGLGHIIVLVIAEPAIENKAASKIRAVAEQFPDLNIAVVGAPEMALVRQRMEQLNIGLRNEVGLAGYGAMRNLGLLLAGALDFDSVVFVDDDVVIDDSAFLEKAMYGLGKLTRSGVPILAKSGFYLNKEGEYLSSRSTKWYNCYWDQATAFNKWISKAMKGPRLSRSNHVCGGCLALHREAFRRVSFDPWIARGEDLDYMLDLRMYGSDIWFDNTWYMHHLPPETKREGLRFRQDIFRWLYEYRKVEYGRTQIDLRINSSTCCRSSRNRCCRTQGLSWSRASRAALSARRGCVASGAPMAPGIVARQERPRARHLDMPKPTVRSISASSRCGLRS